MFVKRLCEFTAICLAWLICMTAYGWYEVSRTMAALSASPSPDLYANSWGFQIVAFVFTKGLIGLVLLAATLLAIPLITAARGQQSSEHAPRPPSEIPKTFVYLLQHLHVFPDGTEDIKTIGVYSTKDSALSAVTRLKDQPGFNDHPLAIDPLISASTSGFHIDQYAIDQDHWQEGYVTNLIQGHCAT